MFKLLLYDGEKEHWVTSCYYDREVKLFDSYFTGKLSESIELQLCQLYNPLISESGGLLVSIIPMQQQSPGTMNCGPFCIAAAYHTALGDDVGALTFNEDVMRPHLVQCFEEEGFSPFPLALTSSVDTTRAEKQKLLVQVNCKCRKPDTAEDMVACDRCDSWLHLSCANITNAPEGEWMCSHCNEL